MKRTSPSILTCLPAVLIGLCVLAAPAIAQTDSHEIAVAAYSHDAFQLTPATPTVSRTLLVDPTTSFSVSVLAPSQTLSVSLVSPSNVRYAVTDPPTSAFAGSVSLIESTNTKPGASYLLSINNPAAGPWKVEVAETVPLFAPLDVITTTLWNNNLRLALVGGGAFFPIGTEVRLALVAFDGTNKVSGLTIEARLFRPFDPTFTPSGIIFRDDGTGADTLAGDGIYEALVNPAQTGNYQIQVEVFGTASTGNFHRSAATTLQIVPHNALITGFSDRGLDDNADGAYDRIGITPSANLLKAGTYVISVRLRAANGKEMQRGVTQTFGLGTATAEVGFPATEILRDLGTNGPYQVTEVRYYEKIEDDLIPADIRYDLGPTAPYLLGQLQHAPLSLSGEGSASGSDTNANELYDLLQIDLGVLADFAGVYNYSVSLTDRNGKELGFVAGTANFLSGSNTLHLSFAGLPIGQAGEDGPYALANLLLFGAGQSLIAPTAFTTPPFLARQFEGFISRNLAPVLKLNSRLVISNAPGQCASLVTAAQIDAGSFDPEGTPLSFALTPLAPYPVGTNLITVTATDTGGLSTNASVTVVVLDLEPPVITCTTSKVVPCSTAWDFDAPLAVDNCGPVKVTATETLTNLACGNTFSATRFWAARDASGNSATCAQTVTVLDTTPPNIVCPSNRVVEFLNEAGATVTFTATVMDSCSAATSTFTPASGSVLPIGVTPVCVLAQDACGNSNTCSFKVQVLGARGVKSNVLAEVIALRSTLTNRTDRSDRLSLDAVICDLQNALTPVGWSDETHVSHSNGPWVFRNEMAAVLKLQNLTVCKTTLSPENLNNLIGRLVKADRLLAVVNLQDAARAGANSNRVARVLAIVAQGDKEAAGGKPAQAIRNYWNAWYQAWFLKDRATPPACWQTSQHEFSAIPNRVYAVQATYDLAKWFTVCKIKANAKGIVNYVDPNPEGHSALFFRIMNP